MKTLDIHHKKPSKSHLIVAREHGGDSLDEKPPGEFYNGAPEVPGFERAENGCLIKMDRCVMPHTDHWLQDFGRGPRMQRSLFWVLEGNVQFKVDGARHIEMGAGDFVVFDHRREHMVLADGEWLGAAWQLQPCRKTPNARGNAPDTARAD